MSEPKSRIWELDFARGLALVGMIVIHLIYDLVDLFGIIPWHQPVWYLAFKNNYGALFLVISGISVTLGSRCVRRGVQVFCAGFLCTAVTLGMYLLGMTDRSIIIYYGVLHCIGTCMILWAVFGKLPDWALVLLGAAMTAAGWILRSGYYEVSWVLIPIGFTPWWFASSDYFPLLPNLGYFLLGAVIGRHVYRQRMSRIPDGLSRMLPGRGLCWMGRNSLLVYLIHQPVLAVLALLLQFCKF